MIDPEIAARGPDRAGADLEGLKKDGVSIADRGGDWRLSVALHSRIKGSGAPARVRSSAVEAVQTTGQNW